MTINRIDIILLSFIILLSIYLFAQSPLPLKEKDQNAGELIDVVEMFKIVAEENNKIRKQWTKRVVVAGKKSGLKFGEDWRKKAVDEGPLPALYLREVAVNLEKSIVPLSLFLGSDFPISSANKFKGRQADIFKKIRISGEPEYFYDEDIQRYTAMFPDNVVVKACYSCHNEHPNTPKKDWKLNDIMGATTWSYPKKYVTRDDLVEIIRELRKSFKKAYTAYLKKTRQFKNPPEVGERWPSAGYYVPDENIFMGEFEKTASYDTLKILLTMIKAKPVIKEIIKN